jgi:hypothetical protein
MSTKKQIDSIIKRLTDINIELIRDFGTDAYEIRCKIYDVKEELSKLHQPTVSDALPNPGHCDSKLLCDDRFCLKGELCNYDTRQ